MPKSTLRLIVDPPLPGAWNMAVDEALLDAAIEGGVATLRFYRWREPTLSLGYFQRHVDRALHAASAGCDCVRRHSGGGAILHDRELTYSLALPSRLLPAGDAEGLYRFAHGSLVELFGKLLPTLAGRLALSSGISRPPADEPFLCFERRSDGDLVVREQGPDGGDHKVVGSAQRKRRGAVLQHGSLLLARSASAPELLGLADLARAASSPEASGAIDPISTAFEDAIVGDWAAGLAERLELTLTLKRLQGAEEVHARQIEASRFGSQKWTARR